jgi:hypothetical protein
VKIIFTQYLAEDFYRMFFFKGGGGTFCALSVFFALPLVTFHVQRSTSETAEQIVDAFGSAPVSDEPFHVLLRDLISPRILDLNLVFFEQGHGVGRDFSRRRCHLTRLGRCWGIMWEPECNITARLCFVHCWPDESAVGVTEALLHGHFTYMLTLFLDDGNDVHRFERLFSRGSEG